MQSPQIFETSTRAVLTAIVLVSALQLACDETPASTSPDAGSVPSDAATGDASATDASATDASATDASAPDGGVIDLFDPNDVLDVAIELPAADWDALRTKTRDGLAMRAGDCTAAPPANPFPWYSATVTIDGTRMESVAIRKRGFLSSQRIDQPPLRLDLDKHVAGRELHGQDDVVLSRSLQDRTHLRQCLALAIVRSNGIPAPRCNFAHVTVNGADLGVYVHVERLDRDFLEQHFADASGTLWEGSGSDFRSDWIGTFEADTNEGTASRTKLDALATALEADDDALLDALDDVIDVDAFLHYWAVEALLGHGDGYAANLNNFYVYEDPTTDRLVFLPWGLDAVFTSTELGMPDDQNPLGVNLTLGKLAHRLFALPSTRASYLAKIGELATALDEDALLAEVTRMEALVRPRVLASERARFDTAITALRTSISNRASVVAQLVVEAEAASPSALPDPPCLPIVGEVSGTFDTTLGALDRDPFTTGDATATLTLGEETLTFTGVGAVAGVPTEEPPRTMVELHARTATRRFVLEVWVNEQSWAAASLRLDMGGVVVTVYEETEPGVREALGIVGPGTLELEHAGTVNGDRVQGAFSGHLLDAP